MTTEKTYCLKATGYVRTAEDRKAKVETLAKGFTFQGAKEKRRELHAAFDAKRLRRPDIRIVPER